jgi:hypothetical protein
MQKPNYSSPISESHCYRWRAELIEDEFGWNAKLEILL